MLNPNLNLGFVSQSLLRNGMLASIAALSLIATNAEANLSAPFDYPGNWTTTQTLGTNATVDPTFSGGLVLNGPTSTGTVQTGFLKITYTITQAGTWNFDWEYHYDNPTATYDNAGFWLNGTFTELANSDNPSTTQAGSLNPPRPLNVGDIIGFQIAAFSGYASSFTITNFSVQSSSNIPEPSSLLLLSTGLGLAFQRSKKNQPMLKN